MIPRLIKGFADFHLKGQIVWGNVKNVVKNAIVMRIRI